MRRMLPSALLLFGLLSALPSTSAQDVQVTAVTSTDTVGVMDQFQLTITISGGDSGLAQTPRLPRLQGLRIVAGPSQSTQYQWINGRSSSSKSYIYVVLPEKEGQFTIEPIEVSIGSKIFKTQPLTVRVTSASRAPAPRAVPADPFGSNDSPRRTQVSGDDVYVTAELDRNTAYTGQQVTLTYHLYTQINVTGLQLQENPPLTGFWVENLDVPTKPVGTRRIINGREYQDYVVKKQALFPNAAGKLKISPSTFAVSVKTAGDFFGIFGQTDTIYRKTSEVTLEVKTLPQPGRPEGFRDAVGSFILKGELNKAEVAAGDALSLSVKLSGRGNLKEIPDLPLPAIPDLTIYSTKREDIVRPVEGDQIGGEKVWEYVIVPKVPGEQKIPPIAFSFYDPEREKYETVSTEPMSFKVARGSDSSGAFTGLPAGNKQSLTRQGRDINFIKLSAADLSPRQEPISQTRWVIALFVLPLLFNAGVFLYQRERTRQSMDVVLARSRRARRVALNHLRRADHAGRLEPRRFYDEAGIAFAGYLADRFNLPAIAVTADGLERIMSERSIPEEPVKGAVAARQECDFGRFVSASAQPEQRAALDRRIRSIVETLERIGK